MYIGDNLLHKNEKIRNRIYESKEIEIVSSKQSLFYSLLNYQLEQLLE